MITGRLSMLTYTIVAAKLGSGGTAMHATSQTMVVNMAPAVFSN